MRRFDRMREQNVQELWPQPKRLGGRSSSSWAGSVRRGSAVWGQRFVWAGGGAPPRAFCKAPAGAGAPTPRLPPYLRKELCKQLSSAIEGAVPPQANVPGGASARAGHGGRCWGVGASRGTGRPASWRRARRPGLPLPRGQVQAPSTVSHLAPWRDYGEQSFGGAVGGARRVGGCDPAVGAPGAEREGRVPVQVRKPPPPHPHLIACAPAAVPWIAR